MKHAERRFRNLLDQYLKRHGEPSRDDVASAVEQVWRRIEPDAQRAPAQLSLRSAPTRRWRATVAAVAAAAVVALLSPILIRQWVSTDSARAVIESADGEVYRIANGEAVSIRIGGALGHGETVRTDGGAGAMLALVDGSRVEMRSQSELSLERTDDGIGIRLRTGGIIVNAAKQRGGHLYVQTKDITVSVVGTVFLVNAAKDGSRVAVIEGEVRVREAKTETKLRPGDHVSTNPILNPLPVKEEIAWSRQAAAHVALLQQSVAQNPVQPTDQSAPTSETAQGSGASTGSTQVASKPRFEEASIRPCAQENASTGGRGGGANSLILTPGRLYAQCLTVATLIRTAYGYGPMELELMDTSEPGSVREPGRGIRVGTPVGLGVEDGRRVRGGPEWVRDERYTIEAIADPATNADTMKGPMLQELLERRFQLKVHIEAEQVPAFALTVASGGLKIKPMQEGDITREPASAEVKAERERRGWRGPILITEAQRLGVKPTSGVYGDTNGPNFRWEHVGSALGSVAFGVGWALDARVINRTGITDRFIFAWEFGPDESTPGALGHLARERTGVRKPGWDAPSTLPKGPSIFTALEQQLGLKVAPIRVPREFIVVDRVARPSPN